MRSSAARSRRRAATRKTSPITTARGDSGSASAHSNVGTVTRVSPASSAGMVPASGSRRSHCRPTTSRTTAVGSVYASGAWTPTSWSRTQVAEASSSPPSQASGRWSRCSNALAVTSAPARVRCTASETDEVGRDRDPDAGAETRTASAAASSTSNRGSATANRPRAIRATSEQPVVGNVEHVAAGPQDAGESTGSTRPASDAAWPGRRTRTYAARQRRSRPAPAG